jgi:hypothetical protein
MWFFWLTYSIRGKILKKSNQTLFATKALLARKYAGWIEQFLPASPLLSASGLQVSKINYAAEETA